MANKTTPDETILTRSFTFLLDERTFQRIVKIAKNEDRTKGYVVREFISEGIERRDK